MNKIINRICFVEKFYLMSSPIIFPIKESIGETRQLKRGSIPFIAQRLQLLLVCKRHERTGISKQNLARVLGIDPNSAQRWRMLYRTGGIKALMSHKKTGFKTAYLPKHKNGL